MKKFIVTAYDLITNRHPLNNFIDARLFYGVPRKMDSVERDWNGDLIFSQSNSKKEEIR